MASTTTSTVAEATTTTTAVEAVEAEIVERYMRYWQVRLEANHEPVSPDDPRLVDLAIDPQLATVIAETRARRDQGLAIRRPQPSVSDRRVKVVRLDGDSAELQDCAVNDGIVYRVATGEVVDASVVTRNLASTMRRVGGAWRLAETRQLQQWEGVAGCALASGS